MNMASGSEERVISDGSTHDVDASNEGGMTSEGNLSLKKGPWTPTEDIVLMDYVSKHGEENWNAVQKHTGLAHCGKSFCLRWANHLRPDLKKGPFNEDEERLIIELHAKWGNKWARMATELPGRSDNEIKNFWNTWIKRLQRSGLPIYPADVCLRVSNENQQINNIHHSEPDSIQVDDFRVPQFKSFELHKAIISRMPPLNISLDFPSSNLIAQGTMNPNLSNVHKPLLSTVHQAKHFPCSKPMLQGLNASMDNAFSVGPQFNDSMQIGQSFLFLPRNDDCNRPVADCMTLLNGNPSSELFGTTKLELPSLQTRTANWASPLANFDPVDDLIQTSPSTELRQNNTLLDMYLSASKAMNNSKGVSYLRTSLPTDATTQLTNNFPESS